MFLVFNFKCSSCLESETTESIPEIMSNLKSIQNVDSEGTNAIVYHPLRGAEKRNSESSFAVI